MILIDNVRIRNFRAIKEAKLEPLKDGITGIFGSNGAGKTTFLIGVLFALYGMRPEGATVASLRRHGSEKEECSVSVVFEHLGQTVEVLREISGKENKVRAWVYVDGKEISSGSVSYADKWVRSRLGVDAEGFKTAFVVRQKELDLLVSAKPAERKVIIERLAGIETINEALRKAREEESLSKKALINLPGSLELYTAAEEKFEVEEEKHTALEKRLAAGRAKKEEAQESYNILERKLNAAQDQKYELDREIARLESLTTERKRKQELLDEAKVRHAGVTEDFVKELEAKYQALDVELDNKRAEFNDLNVQSQVAKQTITSVEREITQLSTISKPEKLATDLDKVNKEISKVEKEKENVSSEKLVVGAKKEQLAGALEAVKNEVCPTCLRSWEDHDHNAQNYEKDYTEAVEKLKELSEQESALVTKLTELRELREHVITVTRQKEQYDEAQKRVTELTVQLEEARGRIVTDDVFTRITDEGKKLSARRDAHLSAYTEAKTALTYAEQVKVLEEEITTIDASIPLIQAQVEEKQQTLPDIASIESEYNEAKALLQRVDSLLGEVNEEYVNHNVLYLTAKNERDAQKAQWEARQKAHTRHEQITATTETLDKFRKDSISRLAPELSDYATSLISEMTSGAFTEISLDENFTPSVTDSEGNTRPVTWLSGGEESAVALALRLSIAFLITGGNPELLWLDEVLTAQDADRRMGMLSMIRSLPIKQILIINHTQEASDVVDKVVTLVPNVKSGSVIEQ